MNNEETSPELFAQRPVSSDFSRKNQRLPFGFHVPRIAVVAALVSVLLAGVIALYLKFAEMDAEQPADIPTIKAEGPIKQRPENPGGIDIPHQDVTVFQKIEGNDVTPKQASVEHLLPPPEVPQPQAVDAGVAANPVPAPVVQPQPVVPPQPEKLIATTPAKEVMPTKAGSPLSNVEKSSETNGTPAAAGVTASPSQSHAQSLPKELFTGKTGSGGYRVQLASLPDMQTAQSELKRLQTKYAQALGGVTLHIAQADISGKGTYYRLQGGGLTEAKARSVCAALAAQGAGCIVVKP